MVLVAASLLSADSARLGQEVELLEKANADLLHFDVMDGHFVPNMTYGPLILKALKKHTSLKFDVHLMVENPENFIPWYIDAGADMLTFHLEAAKNADVLIQNIQKRGLKAGISLKPNSDITLLSRLHEVPDIVLVMGVEPGFGGQTFKDDTPERITQTKKLISSDKLLISVDGGITEQTALLCRQAGADILVAGTAIFKNGTYADNIKILKGDKHE